MADVRITDLVDPKAIEDLRTTQEEIKNVRDIYMEVIRLTAQAIKVKVETVGDIDKLNTTVTGGIKKAEEATVQLNEVMTKRKEIIGHTTAEISQELSEITKENKAKREALEADKSSLAYAQRIIGSREKNIRAITMQQTAIKALKEQQKELDGEYKKGVITYDQYIARKSRLQSEISHEEALMKPLKQALRSQNDELAATEGSMKKVSYQLEQMKLAYRQLTDEEKRGAEGKHLADSIRDLDNALKHADEEIGDFHRNVGNYAVAAGGYVDVMLKAVGVNGQFGRSLASLSQAGGGDLLTGMNTKLKALSMTLKGMLANPYVLALLGIGGAIAAFKWWYDYNKGLMEATRLTREFLGLTGDELVEVRSEIQAVADEWGKDYKDVLSTIDILTAQYGIDAQEALRIVRDGFQAGADQSGNMLSNMKNYAPIFRDMGLDGQKLAAVLAQTRSGIFNEQGLEMMRMATKRLREMTSSTQKSLEAIGISTDEWNEKLTSGEANFFDYLQEISRRLGELPEQSNEVGDVLKDVFGRNGAAGGMELVKYFGQMTTSIEEVKKVTGEVGSLHDQHIEKVKELNKKVADLFDVTDEGFEEATLSAKNYLTDTLIKIVDKMQQLVNWTTEWYDESKAFRYVVQMIGATFMALWANVKTGVKQSVTLLQGLANATRALFSLDFEKFGDAVTDLWKSRIQNVKDMGDEIKKAYEDAANAAKNGRQSVRNAMAGEDGGDQETVINASGGSSSTGDGTKANKTKEQAVKSWDEIREAMLEATRKAIADRLAIVEKGGEEERKLSEQLADAEYAVAMSAAQKNYDKQKKELDDSLAKRSISVEQYNIAIATLSEVRTAAELLAEKKKNDAMTEASSNFAKAEIERISERYATEKAMRDNSYIEEVSGIKAAYAASLITREEYERQLYEAKVNYEMETALAVIESLEKQLAVESMTAEQRKKISEELAKAKTDLMKRETDMAVDAMERQKKADDDLAKKRQQNLSKWMQTASRAISSVSGLMGALYDGEMKDLDDQKEESQKKYEEDVARIDSLAERGVITTEEAEARKAAAEKRRADKEAELDKKRQDIEYKKAVWEKATSLAQAGIATALAITQALPNIALAAMVGAMGAIQVATILATPIKAYAKGTGEKGHDGGLAMVGDGGKREVIVIGNTAWLTSDKPTVLDLPKGAKVYPDADEWSKGFAVPGNGKPEKDSNMVVINDYKRLEKKMDERNRLARLSIRMQVDSAYQAEFDRYRKG